MRARLSRLIMFTLMAVLIGATQASAQMCEMLRTVTDDQRSLSRALQQANGAPLSAAHQSHLDQIIENATALTQFNITDPSLRDAVMTYARQNRMVRDAVWLQNDSAIARRVSSDNYRWSVSVLSAVGQSYCDRATDARITGVASEPAMGRLSNLSWKIGVPILLIATLIVGVAAYLMRSRLILRDARRARFDCNVPITIIFDTHRFDTRMIDISAIGAKIAIPADKQVLENAIIMVEGKKYICRRAWYNAHFAGFSFNPPLQLAVVRKWSTKRQTRRTSKTSAGLHSGT